VKELEPLSVKIIGVPADTPYDERIYRVSFELPNIPVDDRIVLNVLSPNGECLSKFHLQLL
jgi:ubiquitin-protein ligase